MFTGRVVRQLGRRVVGEYTADGRLVHKGSKGRAETVASIQGTSIERLRNQLVLDGILAAQGGLLVSTCDHLLPASAWSLQK